MHSQNNSKAAENQRYLWAPLEYIQNMPEHTQIDTQKYETPWHIIQDFARTLKVLEFEIKILKTLKSGWMIGPLNTLQYLVWLFG